MDGETGDCMREVGDCMHEVGDCMHKVGDCMHEGGAETASEVGIVSKRA